MRGNWGMKRLISEKLLGNIWGGLKPKWPGVIWECLRLECMFFFKFWKDLGKCWKPLRLGEMIWNEIWTLMDHLRNKFARGSWPPNF